MKKELVSSIILTHKRPNFLDRAIKSVLNQTYKKWELVVVDDNDENSKYRKETESLMKKYSSNNKIRYIKHKKNKGAPEARKTAVRNAKGKYIAFLDDDDQWLPEKLEKQLEVFEKSKVKNLGLVYCNARYIKDDMLKTITEYNFRGNDIKRFLIKHEGIITSTLMVKTDALKEVGFRKVIGGQDFMLEKDLLDRGFVFDLCKDALINYYQHEQGRITTCHNRLEGSKQCIEIIRKENMKDFSFFERMEMYSNYHNQRYGMSLLVNRRFDALRELFFSILFYPARISHIKSMIRVMLGEKRTDDIRRKIKGIR